MTSSQIPSPIAMPCPFAGDGATLGTIDTTSTNNMNYPKGFPTVYGAPTSASGKFVSRGEMNRLGNIATVAGFRHQCGALNTFDADFADAIDGYPKGAVLDLLSGNQFTKVVSLVDTNKVDFTKVGVDGSSWAYCNTELSTPDTRPVLGQFSVGTLGNNILGYFKAPSAGYVTLETPAEEVVSSGENIYSAMSMSGMGMSIGSGVGFAIKDVGTSFPPATTPTLPTCSISGSAAWNGWNTIAGNFSFFWTYNSDGAEAGWQSGHVYNSAASSLVTANHYYAVAILSSGYSRMNMSVQRVEGQLAAYCNVSATLIDLAGTVKVRFGTV